MSDRHSIDPSCMYPTCCGGGEHYGHEPFCDVGICAAEKVVAAEQAELNSIAIDMAYALTMAVMTEFPKERRLALERWESFCLRLMMK